MCGNVLKGFLKYSKNVEFYIPDIYYDNDAPIMEKLVGKENFVCYKTNGEYGRLEKMKQCDLVIALPGATGTLEELLYCNETSRSGEFKGKILLVNINGYFNGLLIYIDNLIKNGFGDKSIIKFDVLNKVEEVIL